MGKRLSDTQAITNRHVPQRAPMSDTLNSAGAGAMAASAGEAQTVRRGLMDPIDGPGLAARPMRSAVMYLRGGKC